MRLKILRRLLLDKIVRYRKKLFIFIFLSVLMILLFGKHKLFCPTIPSISDDETKPCETFDVVYTWVNGSDTEFIKSIRKYQSNYDPSRFDDKNELKYSLRSLEKYAPWVKHIYIITNGQIPHWLDLANPNITLVDHSTITPDSKYLPTFSSSAIETFLHRIPKLSKKFLYMNDDIFLGAPLYPEDLYTPSEGVKIYNAWTVPDCAIDCPWVYIGDGSCDHHCNIERCQFDGGDCKYDDEQHKSDNDYSDTHKNYFDVAKLKNTTKPPVNLDVGNILKMNLPAKRNHRKSFRDVIKNTNLTNRGQVKTVVQFFNHQQKLMVKSMHDFESFQPTKDIFSNSLIETNMLLNKKYGFKARYVLAHVGFLLDRQIMSEMQIKFREEIHKTAANRFRDPQDLQFAFLYYNYVMSENRHLTAEEVFEQFDTDNSKTWSDREIRTFLSRVYPLPLDWAAVKYFEDVVTNCSANLPKDSSEIHYSTFLYERYEESNIPPVTKRLLTNCPVLNHVLLLHFGVKSRYKYTVHPRREMHSNFMMLTSNLTEVIMFLDKVRRNPKKFNCINDNLDPQYGEENELIKQLLEDFYLSFFPRRSQYELPDHFRNKFGYLKDFEQWKQKKSLTILFGYIASIILIGFLMKFFCLHKSKYARRYIQRL